MVPLLALYLTGGLGLSPALAGLVVSCYGAGGLCAGLLGGVAADGWGRRRTILLSLVGGAVAVVGLGLSRSVPVVALWAGLLGLLGEMYRPAVGAMVADLVPAPVRGRAYAHIYWANNLGFAVAPAAAALVAQISYLLLFLIDGVTMLLYAAVVFRWVRESGVHAAGPAAPPLSGLGTVLRDRIFLALCGLTLPLAILLWQSASSLPLALRAQGMAQATFGLVIASNGVLIILLQPFAVRWVERVSRRRVLPGAALLVGLGFAAHALVRAPWAHAAVVALWTLGEILLVPVLAGIVADLAPGAWRGRYQGLFTMTWGTGAALGPALGGAVLDRLGTGWLWVSCAATGVFMAAGHRLLSRPLEREVVRRAAAV